MQTSVRGIQFIAKNEGFSSTVYDDAGHRAIGYGHDLLPSESFPDGITEDQGLDLLGKDVARIEPFLNDMATGLNQNQFDACVDFAYNLGLGSLRTLLGHGIDQVPDQLPRWVNVQGKPSLGLVARRQAEIELWNTPV
jgi:lysozyme